MKRIVQEAGALGLTVVGAFHPEPEDIAPEGIATLVLLGPGGPDMWSRFTSDPEYHDNADHAMDRWSERVISGLARSLEARAFFPFGGPPWHPFQRWAAKAEGAVVSPVAMQATAARGLWTSYRGALGFPARLDLPETDRPDPCAPCPKPCVDACPVGAFQDGTYDIPRCVTHVRSEAGMACLQGCLVRRACPAGKGMMLPTEQRAFHMAAFLRAQS